MIVGSRFPELRFRLHGNFDFAGESPRMDEPQSSPAGSRGRWRFGVFDFDGQTLELSKNGRLVAARPQPLKLLALLVAHPADVVSREDLQRTLWGSETFVDFEQGVNHAIRELRAALGDTAESPASFRRCPGGAIGSLRRWSGSVSSRMTPSSPERLSR
jgi:DNA-binding response OmpR family regulator